MQPTDQQVKPYALQENYHLGHDLLDVLNRDAC